jgi:transcriptional regulator of acetoin/glycerol metabolism
MPVDTLHRLREANGELLRLSTPAMAQARDFLAETGTMMVLTDARGTILTVEGDPRTVGRAESIRLQPGTTWSELACGTNAIGTALEAGEPVQIHSAEHYCEGIKRWTCSGMVVRHPLDGEILGVVDVSGLSESYSRYSLGLAMTTAGRIENRLAAYEMELRYRLLDAAMGRLADAGADGLILFDRRGVPIKANQAAYALLAEHGSRLDLSRPQRIEALGLPSLAGPQGALGAGQEWIRAEWLQPVLHQGQRLGTLLVLPARRGRGRALRAGPPAPPLIQPARTSAFAHLVGGDAALRQAMAQALQLARSRAPVLLLGETGVGKEEFAQGIHLASPVGQGPFVALNCGGLSRDLLASELFGYAEGAFTGARRGGQAGKIEAADGGTLFLDELGEMPTELQPHLLRVLEQGELYRLGESAPRKVAFRLVAATHRDLRRDVADGRFRMDLFYRVAVASVRIPPLRERRADVRALVAHFLERVRRENGLGPRRFDEQALRCMEAYDWPGNVRELRNVVESLLLMSTGDVIDAGQLPPELTAHPSAGGALSLDDAERERIREAIRATGGNLSDSARRLHIAKSTLYQKLRRYDLQDEVERRRHRH